MKLNFKLLFAVIFVSLNAWAKPPKAKIVEGTRVPVDQYPYVAQLLFEGFTQCTGTLISSRHVLTAAHCFFDDSNTRVVGDRDMTVLLGGQAFNSESVSIHPAYQSRNQACVEGESDAAIIKLATPADGIPAIGIPDLPPP